MTVASGKKILTVFPKGMFFGDLDYGKQGAGLTFFEIIVES
ncbi:hypothetical protein [Achromobacter aegrifaciens]